MAKRAGKRSWTWKGYTFLAATAAMFAAGAYAIAKIPDHDLIRFERWQRVTYASMGWTWPGTPDYGSLDERLKKIGAKVGSPIFMRIFKREFELEVWLKSGGKFKHLTTYPICKWSGRLGPKLQQGDHQAPEGIYVVSKRSLNPNSRWHRSFNLGFPNLHDRSHDRTGSFLMVHGGCSSVGCYAMTNDGITEIWKLVTAALNSGQRRFQVQAFPFRMTEENLAAYPQGAKNNTFWQDLKVGYDLFEKDHVPPRVSVCDKRYAFEASTDKTDGSYPLRKRCPAPAADGPQSS